MKSSFFSLILILLTPLYACSQPPIDRYTTALFPNITETTNVLFSSNVPKPEPGGGFYEAITGYPINVDEFNTTPVNLYMNIFTPANDTLSKRPVIIICFGGGFVAGSKDHWSIRLLAQELTKRGFVTAVIDYRLGMNIFDEQLSKRALYRGVQDGRSAIRFFKADAVGANIYKIDPDQIYIGGHSAGAFIATHNAYLDKESERPASTYQWPQGCGFLDLSTCWCPNQGCLDCVGNNQNFDGKAKAVFSLAGAVGDPLYLENNSDPKVVMFHSQDDDTVPYDQGEPFSGITWAVIGDDLPTVYGSLPISIRASAIGLENQFNSYSSRGHDVHEASGNTLYNDIIPNISEWFFTKLLKPADHVINGNTYVCTSNLVQSYTAVPGTANYYDWQIIGGSFVSMDPWSNEITVNWDHNAPIKTISLTPFSVHDARGETNVLNITTSSTFLNTWSSNTGGNWDNISNWSLGQLPDICHDVVIPASSNYYQINAPEAIFQQIRSIFLGNHVTLIIPDSSQIIIEE